MMHHTESEDTQHKAPAHYQQTTVSGDAHGLRISSEVAPGVEIMQHLPEAVVNKLVIEWMRAHPHVATELFARAVVEEQARQAVINDARRGQAKQDEAEPGLSAE